MGLEQRRERERERRRQQIIMAARRVLEEKGFAHAKLEDIAAEAELSLSTIYSYFKGKDDLFASASLRVLKYLQIKLLRVKSEKGLINAQEQLKSLQRTLCGVDEFDRLTLINTLNLQSSEAMSNLSPELLGEVRRLFSELLKLMADILQRGISEGVFVQSDPLMLAKSLWALFSGVIFWAEGERIGGASKNQLKLALETAFEIFRRGIKEASGDMDK